MPVSGAPALRDGYLVKRGHVVRSWRRRFCSLGAAELRYFRAMGEVTPRGAVCLDGAKVEAEVPVFKAGRRGNVFAVIERSGKRFLFQCHDASERAVSPFCPTLDGDFARVHCPGAQRWPGRVRTTKFFLCVALWRMPLPAACTRRRGQRVFNGMWPCLQMPLRLPRRSRTRRTTMPRGRQQRDCRRPFIRAQSRPLESSRDHGTWGRDADQFRRTRCAPGFQRGRTFTRLAHKSASRSRCSFGL